MSLARLLRHLSTQVNFPIPIDLISSWMLENSIQDSIAFVPVDIDPSELKGMYVGLHDNRHATIFYSIHLEEDWMRFVQCKELIHGFDRPEARAGSQQEIDDLTFRLVSRSTAELDPKEFHLPSVTDQYGIVPALLALAPMPIVDKIREQYESGEKSDYDVAQFFHIPEVLISLVFSPAIKEISEAF